MASIFTLENVNNFSEKLNIDDLYEKKKQFDLNKLELFNKILNRIHVRIKTTSRQKINEQFCWFVVPEVIIGVPKYDQGSCIAYLMDKLNDNGFRIRYIHPNTLFICWQHWVPSYIRNELKSKTGIIVDEFGNRIENNDVTKNNNSDILKDNMNLLTKQNKNVSDKKSLKISKEENKKNFTPITSYKPKGNFIYDEELFDSLDGKL